MLKYLLLFVRIDILDSETMLIDMSFLVLHMNFLYYNKETLPGCPFLSFIMTTHNQSITTMIWSQLQIKNLIV